MEKYRDLKRFVQQQWESSKEEAHISDAKAGETAAFAIVLAYMNTLDELDKCEVSPYSSRICEHGTRGCTKQH